jgi:dihydroorotate dehydrogenase (fumarate)
VAAYLLAGADVVMSPSALLRHASAYAAVLLDGLQTWMERKGLRTLGDVRGMFSVPAGADAAAYERAGHVVAMRAANAGVYQPR